VDWPSFFGGVSCTLVCVGIPAALWFYKFVKDMAGWW
jgi:hypothetical protein